MTVPHDPATERQPAGSRLTSHCPATWPILACCTALLTGAVALVLAHKAGITFLLIFLSSIAILLLLIAESGHGLLAPTVQRGLAKLRDPHSSAGRTART